MYDGAGKKGFGFEVTGPFTKFDQSDATYVRNTTADTASMISTNAGRVSAVAGAMASVSNPAQLVAATTSITASSVGLVASAIEQMLRPNLGQFTVGFATDMAAKPFMDRLAPYGPLINEGFELFKNSAASSQIQDQLNRKNK